MGIEYNLLSSETANVSNFGCGIGHSEFNFTELINDMEIPASIEEVSYVSLIVSKRSAVIIFKYF